MDRWLSKEEEELVLNNQGLIRYLVNQFKPKPSEFEDMCQIAEIGMIKAAKTFKGSKNVKFATYAATCIKNEIRMFLRKEKKHLNVISLEEPVKNKFGEDEGLTLADTTALTETEFTENIMQNYEFVKFMSIVLNFLKPRDRLIMLYKISGINQISIAKTLKTTQSYISRLERKVSKKVKEYFINEQQYKEVFKLTKMGDEYKITFSSKDVSRFNLIFSTLLSNLTSTENLPDFKLNCNKERIIIQIPAEAQSFSLIAEIIREIDEFSMTYVSNKEIELNQKALEDSKKSNNIDNVISENASPNKLENEMDKSYSEENKTLTLSTKKSYGKAKEIRDYILSLETFSVRAVKDHFSETGFTTPDINGVIMKLKKEERIKAITRGIYTVIKS